jgi:uncharacterized RDD family membrane protein YckC
VVTRVIANTIDALSVIGGLLVAYGGYNAALFMINPREFEFTRASALLSVGTFLGAPVVYLTAAWWFTGRSYGKHVMGLRVVGRHGDSVGPLTALVRAIFCVGFPIGLLGCAWRNRRSLQDVILRTSVVYDWRPWRAGEPVVTA